MGLGALSRLILHFATAALRRNSAISLLRPSSICQSTNLHFQFQVTVTEAVYRRIPVTPYLPLAFLLTFSNSGEPMRGISGFGFSLYWLSIFSFEHLRFLILESRRGEK